MGGRVMVILKVIESFEEKEKVVLDPDDFDFSFLDEI